MQWSFPKSERFPNRAFKSPCSCAFYDLPHHLYRANRTAGFGWGDKYDFTKGASKTPGPCGYTINRSLERTEPTYLSTFSRGNTNLRYDFLGYIDFYKIIDLKNLLENFSSLENINVFSAN